uniref:ABC transmembrane type-1 domain-containing protein n=1 Tax=Ditylenchus dipsaci TaxID=166011 RepID=A0A915E1E3_9BILA
MKDSTFSWDTSANPVPEPSSKLTKNGKSNGHHREERADWCLRMCGQWKNSSFARLSWTLVEESGTFAMSGTAAFVSQNPFVCNTTIRENILFGSAGPMNSQRYYKSISSAQLTKDLETMPANELSEINESGTTLSGGQKARLALLEGQQIGFDTHQKLLSSSDLYNNFFNTYSQLRDQEPKVTETASEDNAEEIDGNTKSDGESQASNAAKLIGEEELGLSKISTKIYLEYIKAAGGLTVCCFVLVAFLINVGSGIFSTYWLSKWLTDVHGRPANNAFIGLNDSINATDNYSLANDPNLSFYATVYGCSILILFVLVTLCASTNLHNSMLNHVLHGVTSFFDTTPAGRILNRFSKDLDEIDVKLPFSAEALLQYMITCIGFVGIIASVFPIFLCYASPHCCLCALLLVLQIWNQELETSGKHFSISSLRANYLFFGWAGDNSLLLPDEFLC